MKGYKRKKSSSEEGKDALTKMMKDYGVDTIA